MSTSDRFVPNRLQSPLEQRLMSCETLLVLVDIVSQVMRGGVVE